MDNRPIRNVDLFVAKPSGGGRVFATDKSYPMGIEADGEFEVDLLASLDIKRTKRMKAGMQIKVDLHANGAIFVGLHSQKFFIKSIHQIRVGWNASLYGGILPWAAFANRLS